MVPISRSRFLGYLFAAFLAGVLVAVFMPSLALRVLDHVVLPISREEIARATSPDGMVDAVIIRTNCGAPCSFGYRVFIVGKGMPAPANSDLAVFSADSMTGEALVWKQAHLLTIAYNRAEILNFHNVSFPFREFGEGKEDTWRYKVEVALTPASPVGFSYLQGSDLQ